MFGGVFKLKGNNCLWGEGGCKIDICKWKFFFLYKVNVLNYEIGMGESYFKI